ncbi:MAG: PQQ-like beta-propeller repeat protein [Candidatus Coatesbacteria bacterium]|nr:PQQ-like beta-propeller repeat protein [Candidatus Coatesbacteria bacterium]
MKISSCSVGLLIFLLFSSLASAPGEKIWEYNSNGYAWAYPFYYNNIAYFGNGNNSRTSGTIYALNAENGTEIWKFDLQGIAVYEIVQAYGNIYVSASSISASRSYIHCLNPYNGKCNWTYECNADFFTGPCVYNNQVFFGFYDPDDIYYLYSINALNGDYIWKFWAERIIRRTPSVGKKAVFFNAEFENMYSLKYDTGDIIWKYRH